MRRIILLLVLLTLASSVFSQRRGRRSKGLLTWFSFAPKAGFGNSIFINSNMLSDNNLEYDFLTSSYFYGGSLGLAFNYNFGLNFEMTWGKIGQDVDLKEPEAYTKEFAMNTSDIAIMFRYTSDFGSYVEFGPRFQTLNSLDVTNSTTLPSSIILDEANKDRYNEKFTTLTFGFGLALFRSEDARFGISLGARINYTLDNIMKDEGTYFVQDGHYFPKIANGDQYTSDATTNPLTIQVMLEINYLFGYYGTASCGKPGLKFFED